ncbi:hypothetical protein K7432_016427 [Basidiobolus ranarum]|uniref:Phosphodiester glycosidase domain-containing protein n=1 Tax=Basidiobolus ranarum TaxID=34480 RepID=A0ABR2VLM8_9FUNG
MSLQAGIIEDGLHASTVIISDLGAVDVTGVGRQSVSASGKYGINGGFFVPEARPERLLSIAFSRGAPVPHGGHMNGDEKRPKKRGTMICYETSKGELKVEVAVLVELSEFQKSLKARDPKANIVWAIGGYSLHLRKNGTDKVFLDCLKKDEETQGITGVDYGRFTQRSAIGFRNADRKVVLASFHCLSVLEVRRIMKHAYQCDIAIMLDGGGSSQIAGKSSSDKAVKVNYSKVGSYERPIFSMVTVETSDWVDVGRLISDKIPISDDIIQKRVQKDKCGGKK